jgi:hypothetical protein
MLPYIILFCCHICCQIAIIAHNVKPKDYNLTSQTANKNHSRTPIEDRRAIKSPLPYHFTLNAIKALYRAFLRFIYIAHNTDCQKDRLKHFISAVLCAVIPKTAYGGSGIARIDNRLS